MFRRLIGKHKSSSSHAHWNSICSEVVIFGVLSNAPHEVNWLGHCHLTGTSVNRSVVDGHFFTGTHTLVVNGHVTVSVQNGARDRLVHGLCSQDAIINGIDELNTRERDVSQPLGGDVSVEFERNSQRHAEH
jgi:hypothetical protein